MYLQKYFLIHWSRQWLIKHIFKSNMKNLRIILCMGEILYIAIVMPPPLGTGGIMFSGCPSVRPKPEILSFHLYMGPLVHPTNRDCFAACPSVRRGFRAFAGERMDGIASNFACWCILTSFKTDKILYHFNLVKRVEFGVSGHLPESAWRECPKILHATVSWPPSELISLWSWSVELSNFGFI